MTNESSFQHKRDEFLIRNYNVNQVDLHRSSINDSESLRIFQSFSNRKKPDYVYFVNRGK